MLIDARIRTRPTVRLTPAARQTRRDARTRCPMTLMPIEGTIVRSLSTSEVVVTAPSAAHRVWFVDVELTPPGRAPFVITERLLVPVYERGPAVGARVPAIVSPTRDEATISVTSLTGITPGTTRALLEEGVRVLVSDDIVDPVEIHELLRDHELRTRPTLVTAPR